MVNLIVRSELERISSIDDDKLARKIAGFLAVSDPKNSRLYKHAYNNRISTIIRKIG